IQNRQEVRIGPQVGGIVGRHVVLVLQLLIRYEVLVAMPQLSIPFGDPLLDVELALLDLVEGGPTVPEVESAFQELGGMPAPVPTGTIAAIRHAVDPARMPGIRFVVHKPVAALEEELLFWVDFPAALFLPV